MAVRGYILRPLGAARKFCRADSHAIASAITMSMRGSLYYFAGGDNFASQHLFEQIKTCVILRNF